MSDPVVIKIVPNNKYTNTIDSLNKTLVFDILSLNNSETIKPFYRFQQTWVQSCYATFKDFDTYIILMYLKNKIYIDYSDRFHFMSADEFYKQESIDIDKINLIQISKSLDIPKETIRRKINYLQEKKIIFRSGKSIYLNSTALELVKPNKSLPMLSIYLEKISIVLAKESWFGKFLDRKNIEKFIRDHFTLCWEYFYRFQIPYLTRHKKYFGDLESWNVWASIALVQMSSFEKLKKNVIQDETTSYEDYFTSLLKLKMKRGINASSISDITSIPRATVIRKLKSMEKKGLIKRNKKLEYNLGSYIYLKDFKENYIINQNALSDFCTTLFNLMKNSKLKIQD